MTTVLQGKLRLKSQPNQNQNDSVFEVTGCGKCVGVRGLSMRIVMMVMMTLWIGVALADVSVSDIQVFSGYPWKEVVVAYTITGSDEKADIVRLTAYDKTVNNTYVVEAGSPTLTGAKLSEGRHVLRWDAAKDGVKFSSEDVVFTVSVVSYGGVQLWSNGPYWAECNVGATKPEEYGNYFWWGDTVGYKRNPANDGWISAKNGSSYLFSQENCPTDGADVSRRDWSQDESLLRTGGYIDSTEELVAAHDAAKVHPGTPWRMPTDAELNDLVCNCDTSWTTYNGVCGWLVKGRGVYATKSIFLPAAGRAIDSRLDDAGSRGYYRSSTYHVYGAFGETYLRFDSSGFRKYDYFDRFDGRSVRPLRVVAQ